MRIGISTRGLHQGSFAISTIIYHLTQTMIEKPLEDVDFFLYFNDPQFEKLFQSNVQKRSIKLSNRFVWDHIWLPNSLKKDEIDIALFMKGTMPVFLPCKGAVVINDLGYFNDKLKPYKILDTLYMKRMIKRATQQAVRIFTISEYTKKQTANVLGVQENHITVSYPSCSDIFRPVTNQDKLDEIKTRYHLPSRFIFAPISISPRKNIDRILAAFNQASDEIPEDLVITGGQTWGMRQTISQIKSNDRVHILGTVHQNDLPAIYRLASFTLYPSLLEGFGIPILEAFNCGCPVLTSNVTSMPEVAGDAAYLVNPYDLGQITTGIRKLSKDQELRQALILRGYERAKDFSWETMAATIIHTLR